MTAQAVLHFVNLLAAGVVAGAFVMAIVAVGPAMAALPDEAALRFKQAVDPRMDRINPPAVVLSTITGVLLLIFADDLSGASIAGIAVGLAGSAGIGLTSLGVNMRINRLMGAWSDGAPPAEFRAILARWDRWHALRTFAGVTAFAGYLVGAVAAID